MKIGIVSSYFYPWYGGISEHVYYQYQELKRRGHQVKVITPFDGRDMLDDDSDLIKIGRPIPLIVNGSAVKIPILPRAREVTERILSQERFDILHLHQPLFCVLGRSFLRSIRERKRRGWENPRVVGTFHACGGNAEKMLLRQLRFHFRQFRNDFDHRIAVSQASLDFILPFLPGSYSIIPNGVDLNRFSRNGSKIPMLDDGVLNILFVGRLEPRKGLTVLLRSMALLPRYTDKKFRLVVVGNGILTKYYKCRVPREAADRVIFTGGIPFDDLPDFYHSSHLFCSPAAFGESFGIVLIEAMAAGLPIVAGDNAGYRTVIHDGVTGVLVNPHDPEDVARRIGELLNSETMRRYLSGNGLKESSKYGWPDIIDKIENIYYSFYTEKAFTTCLEMA